MKLHDLVQLQRPSPWVEGDNIPWHDPTFSAAMLAEHLDQSHDLASRRAAIIDQHVAWIEELLPTGRAAKVLDLGCGPGLYSNRLARHGHQCTGIDYSPASIAHAQGVAQAEQLPATYHLADIRQADYGEGYDLAMLLYGELNVFRPSDAAAILAKVACALRPGGRLLLEPHTYAALHSSNQGADTWFRSRGGLFSPQPHICLIETIWDDVLMTSTRRYFVIPGQGGEEVTRYAQSLQAYSSARYRTVLQEHGFTQIQILPGLAHDRLPRNRDFVAIVAVKA